MVIRVGIRILTVSLVLGVWVGGVARGDDQERLFPPDSGMIDVTKPPYSATGDGRTDDTDAILKAIRDADFGPARPRVLFFPKGTYLVSKTLDWKGKNGKWSCCLVFWGQGPTQTCIRLKDNAPGFDDPASPKAVIYTASGLEPGPHWAERWPGSGEGNAAFRNSLRGLTIDVGRGNPGAVGIDWLANNVGFLREVTVRASDSAICGIQMHREEPGPALIKNVRIEGFDFGISLRGYGYGITVENLGLKGQRLAGVRNNANAIFIRNLDSENAIPAVQNQNFGYVMLLNASLRGGKTENWAIENDQGVLYARDAECKGYGGLIRNKAGHARNADGPRVAEFVSHDTQSLFDSAPRSLHLAIEETPDYHTNDFSRWANVCDYGAKPNDYIDDAPAIQAAIDSGKEVVYLPTGRYVLGKSIVVRGAVRKIYGMESFFVAPDKKDAFLGADGTPKPLITVADGPNKLVVIEGLWIGSAPAFNESVGLQHVSRDLAIRDCAIPGKWNYCSGPAAGKLYLEDVILRARFAKGQRVWARQFDSEFQQPTTQPLNRNDGADLWVMGIKTEGARTVIETRNGGRTELLGAILDPVRPTAAETPAFINDGSAMSLSYVLFTHAAESRYQIHVRETRGGQTRNLMRADLPRRGDGYGSFMPLYRGHAADVVPLTPTAKAVQYIVDQKHGTTVPDAPGTEDRPFATISQAVDRLRPGDTLLIKSGVYREAVTITRSGTPDKPITIAAFPGDEGKVVISGSDAITGWKHEVSVLWSVPWTQKLEAKFPADWEDWGEYAKRCEMVFVRGQPLTQVLAVGLVRRGTFCVDERKGKLLIALGDFGGPGPVEVAVRQRGLYVHASNLRLSGLTVTHVASPYPEGAFHVWGNDIEIRDCRAEWNNLDGLRLAAGNCRVLNGRFDNNGKCGIAASIRNCLLEGNITNGNSWRYGPECEAGGVKIVGGAPSGNRIVAHTARDNNGRGIWFDYGCKDNRVERCVVDGNLISGIEMEACLAENWIVNCVVTRTRVWRGAVGEHGTGAGIMLYESAGTHILNNTIAANERCGLMIAGGSRVIHYDKSEATSVNTQAFNNIFAGNGDTAIQFWVWDKSAAKESLASHRSDYNLFFPGEKGVVAQVPPGKRLPALGDWQKAFNQDVHSVQADPQFADPSKGDYHLTDQGPAARAGTAMGEVTQDCDGKERPKDKPSLGAYERAGS